jgi:hypothetical protein
MIEKINFILWKIKFRHHLRSILNKRETKSELILWKISSDNIRDWRKYTPRQAAFKFSQYHWN